MIAPVRGPIVQAFNATVTGEVHHGVDVGASPGTPVVAPIDGTVLFAGLDDSGQDGGGVLRIAGDDGPEYVLVHVDAIGPRPGERVAAGQAVAVVATPGTAAGGNAIAPHLHLQVEAGRGNYVDPTPLLAASDATGSEAAARGGLLAGALVVGVLLWLFGD